GPACATAASSSWRAPLFRGGLAAAEPPGRSPALVAGVWGCRGRPRHRAPHVGADPAGVWFCAVRVRGHDNPENPGAYDNDRSGIGRAALAAALPAFVSCRRFPLQLAESARSDECPHLDAGPDVTHDHRPLALGGLQVGAAAVGAEPTPG